MSRPMHDWYARVDAEFTRALTAVMTASTSVLGRREIDWREFNEAMTAFKACAEERHAAKHAAIREAETGPIEPIKLSDVLGEAHK